MAVTCVALWSWWRSAQSGRERDECDSRALSLLLAKESPDWKDVAQCARASRTHISVEQRVRIIEELLHGRRNQVLPVFDGLADGQTVTVLLGHLRDAETPNTRRYILSALERMPVELSGAQFDEIADLSRSHEQVIGP